MDYEGNWLPGVVTPEGSVGERTPRTSVDSTPVRGAVHGLGAQEMNAAGEGGVAVQAAGGRRVLVEEMDQVLRQLKAEEEEEAEFLAALENAKNKLLKVLKVLATHVGQNMVGPKVGTALFLWFFPGWPLYT